MYIEIRVQWTIMFDERDAKALNVESGVFNEILMTAMKFLIQIYLIICLKVKCSTN